jgi:putative Holliday junction resolvase
LIRVSDLSAHPALGIDYGDARIGIAASDPVGIMAHPVETIHRQQQDPLARISAIIQQRQIKTIILGMPCHLDGREGESAQKVRRFAAQLQALHPSLPLHFIDEAYTTVSAAAKLHEAGKNAKKQKSLIDQAAAVEILQLWMDGQAHDPIIRSSFQLDGI